MAKKPTLREYIDLCYAVRKERLDLEKEVDALKAKQKELEELILAKFTKDEISSARGGLATAAVTRKTVPEVEDWGLFQHYILENNALEMLERRPSVSACRERWDANETIPGLKPRVVVGLSLTKVGE